MAKPVWKCKHGCDQKWFIKKTGRYCKHLEALLNAPAGLSGWSFVGPPRTTEVSYELNPEDAFIEKEEREQQDRAGLFDFSDLELDDENAMRLRLRSITELSPTKVEVIVLRVSRGLTFKEIAKELGYSGKAAAHTAFTDAVKMLRRGKGYGKSGQGS